MRTLNQNTKKAAKRKKQFTQQCNFLLTTKEKQTLDAALECLRNKTHNPKLKLSYLLRHSALMTCQRILEKSSHE